MEESPLLYSEPLAAENAVATWAAPETHSGAPDAAAGALSGPIGESPEIFGAESQRAAAEILRAGESANTRRAYQAAIQYWRGWHQARFGRVLGFPVQAEVVLQFLVDHLKRSKSEEGARPYGLPESTEAELLAKGLKGRAGAPALSTVIHRVAVLSKLHELRSAENPARDPRVRQLMASARRAHTNQHTKPNAKRALTLDLLRRLVATCEEDLRGLRDRALLLFAFASGGRRRSEVIAVQVEDLVPSSNGGYEYQLRRSKTDQSGKLRRNKPVYGEAAEALTAWLEASGVTKGAVFRRVVRREIGEAMSGDAVWWMVRRRARLAGLSWKDFGAHSLRSGYVTEAAQQRISIAEVMSLTEHRSVQSVVGYFQAGELRDLPAANLLKRN